MSTSFVFALIAFACGFTSNSLVDGLSWVDVRVFSPPPPTVENENITYVHDGLGHLHKLDVNKVKNEPAPFFSVEKDVHFELFTHKNPTKPQILKLDNYTSVKNSNFNWWHPTRILIHGWFSGGVLTPQFADAYLVRGKYKVNFIAVNWQKGSDVFNYFNARYRVNEVAEYVAKFVDFMFEKARLNINDLTIVGHSLGAHISGIAGKKITKEKVGRIVGLDPASPLFKYNNVEDRLAETDASYVEVIHTCAGTLGFSQPLGVASFYPNGGRSQPGCGWDMSGACAHRRAYELYIESIFRPQFYAFQCESLDILQKGHCSVVNQVVQMGGEPGTKKAKGIYFLQTNGEALFSRGKRAILQAVLSAEKSRQSVENIMADLFYKKSANETVDTPSNNIEEYKSKGLKSILMKYFKTSNGTVPAIKGPEKMEPVELTTSKPISFADFRSGKSMNETKIEGHTEIAEEVEEKNSTKPIKKGFFGWFSKKNNNDAGKADEENIPKFTNPFLGDW